MKFADHAFNAIVLIFVLNLSSMGDEVLKDRFLLDYPRESKMVATRLARVKGKIFAETSDKKQKIVYEFQADHGKEKVHFVKTGVSRGVSIRLESVENYDNGKFFSLERHQSTEPFSLKGIGTSEREVLYYENYSGRFLTVPLGARPMLLYKIMETKTFELLDVSWADASSGQIWVTFLYGSGLPKRKCRALLDTANHWAVLRQEFYHEESGKVESSMTVEYGELLEGVRLPRVVHMERSGRKDNPAFYSDWKFAGTPEAEFNLKYYELPDVLAMRDHKRGARWYWLVFVVVCIGSIRFFFVCHKRLQNSKSNQYPNQV